MMAQPERGSSYAGLRKLLFVNEDDSQGLALFPDGMGKLEDELRRYQMLRFGSRIGFKPPYFYNHSLRNRLYRISAPTLVIWGEKDRMVPLSHGETYARAIRNGLPLKIIERAGHSVHVEKPDDTAEMILNFLAGS
jgi:pimeloyl-ACP methyl ester carboxylesterase